jgi:hypothetical protein
MESENENVLESESEPESEPESELNNDLENQFDILNYTQQLNNYHNHISNRISFENELYDHLISSTSLNGIFFTYSTVYSNVYSDVIDETFWEPVVVSYEKIDLLESIDEQGNCSVCTEDQSSFKRLKCCNQKLCVGCCEEWFGRSVKCPYCYQDLRDFDKIE